MTKRPAPAQAGFVLVAVLWMLALLAGLATIYSAYARATAASATLPLERLRAEADIRSAVELTVYNLLSAPAQKRLKHGSFEFPLGSARIGVAFRTETGRIDLNLAGPELLAALFQGLGMKAKPAAAAAAEIVDWRQPATATATASPPDTQTSVYRNAGLPYDARHKPFEDALELALIPGLDPDLIERALPHLTVYSGAQADPAEADDLVRAVLAASGQASPAAPGASATATPGPIAPPPPDQATPAAPDQATPAAGTSAPIAGQPAQVFRTSIVIATPHRRTLHANVVFSLQEQGDDPYSILFWRDDFDAPLGVV